MQGITERILNECAGIPKKHHIKTCAARFVLKELTNQSDELCWRRPASINYVRLTTIVIDGEVHFFYPAIKVGRHGNFFLNACDDGFLGGIDMEAGRCNTEASDEFGNTYETHPDTGIRFKGF